MREDKNKTKDLTKSASLRPVWDEAGNWNKSTVFI